MTRSDAAALAEMRRAELRAELVSAALRALIFLVLVVVFVVTEFTHDHTLFASLSLSLYGVVSGAALLLAWRRFYHPALAYGLVSLDVILVATHLILLVRMLAAPHSITYALPAAGLIYLVLVHSALRFRPGLVLYAAALFLVVLEGSRWFLPDIPPDDLTPLGDPHQTFLYQHALPFSIVTLTAAMLWTAGMEVRRMIVEAIEQAGRIANLSQFFSPSLADRLASTRLDGHSGDRKHVAILFVDMRGFTRIGRTLAPDSLAEMLTEFRELVTPAVFQFGGAIDKFIGDGALIVFGSIEQRPDDAAQALQCGERIIEAVTGWSEQRRLRGQSEVRVGIGGHYGEVFVGVLGRGSQLEFTVIGDAVNVAERIERVTREISSDFVVSQPLLQAAGKEVASGDRWHSVGVRSLPGHGGDVQLFAIRTSDDEADSCAAS